MSTHTLNVINIIYYLVFYTPGTAVEAVDGDVGSETSDMLGLSLGTHKKKFKQMAMIIDILSYIIIVSYLSLIHI